MKQSKSSNLSTLTAIIYPTSYTVCFTELYFSHLLQFSVSKRDEYFRVLHKIRDFFQNAALE